MPLFRPQALRGQDTLHGEVSLAPPVSWQALGVFMLGSLAVAVAFMAFAGYAKVTAVKGVVTGDRGVVRIAPTRAGVLDQVFVREGQSVAAGAPLACIAVATSTDEGALQTRRAAALGAQREALARRLATVEQDGSQHLASLASQIAGERAQIAGLTEQIVQEKALIRAAEEDLESIRPVARQGFVAKRVLREREEQVALRKQTLSRLSQDVDARRTAIAVAQANIVRTRAATAGQASQIAETRASLEGEAAGEDLLSGVVLRAPVAGVVTAVTAHAGDPTTPGAAVMTLVPKGTRLEAALSVPPSAAGLLELQQPVRIAVDAFPYQVYGALDGKVTSISRAAAPASGGQGEAFLVRATLPPTVFAYGAARELRPGMTLTARIRTRPRSLLAWIFDPVLAVQRR
ncbi:MAG: secretion protein HlyD family protein [Phenylobacterium sp.]|nr:secretion protein HlyD family protein [Phenylobacterium sp.]